MAKTCRKCGVSYENPHFSFHRDRRRKDGLQSRCKQCGTRMTREWEAKHPERSQAIRRAGYQRHRARRLAWHKANYAANRERIKARVTGYYEQNRDKVIAYHHRRYNNDPAPYIARARNKHAVTRGIEGAVTPADIRRLFVLQKGRCYWCDGRLRKVGWHADHVMPLKLGGAHAAANLVISCGSCNNRKRAKHPADFNPSRWAQFQRERGLVA